MRSAHGRLLAVGAVLIIGLAACTEDAEPEAPAAEPASPTEEPASPDDVPEPAQATLAASDSELGTILVDAQGLTLYVFLADADGESTCYDECADTWPPLTVDSDPAAGDGVDETLLGTVARTDGATQVTYANQPLYLYAPDQEPGDVSGQSVGEVWFVVGPDGEPIGAGQAVTGGYERGGYG
jgi:predicted lipoprotein with Yx(FWY)xxD motif